MWTLPLDADDILLAGNYRKHTRSYLNISYFHYFFTYSALHEVILVRDTLTRHFIRYNLLVPFWFRAASILCGTDLKWCWDHSSENLVHIDIIASRSCSRFVNCTFIMKILFHRNPNLLYWIVIWWQKRSFKYSQPVWDRLSFVTYSDL